MGRHGQRRHDVVGQEPDLQALLSEKNQRISYLETQLEAFSARASNTQTRLLATLDVLDSLQSQHAAALSEEQRENGKLKSRLARAVSSMRVLEAEKDDLKDAVEQLIRKVEMSNNLSTWPCSRLQASSYAGPLDLETPLKQNAEFNKDLMGYATGVISRLRAELEHERKARLDEAQAADARVSELQAQVAVREAELEQCALHGCDISPATKWSDSSKRKPRALPKMSDEECLAILQMNNARNKTLEDEIHALARSLGKARMYDPRAEHNPVPSDDERQLPHHYQHSHLPSSRPEFIPQHHALEADPSKPPNTAPQDLPDYHTARSTHNSVKPPAPHTIGAVGSLDQQVLSLKEIVSTLQSEKDSLVQSLEQHKAATDALMGAVHQSELFQNPTHPLADRLQEADEGLARLREHNYALQVELEEARSRKSDEIYRLQEQIFTLRRELEDVPPRHTAREKELLMEIETLRALTQYASPRAYDHPTTGKLDEELDAEENMELASPLQPTVLFHSQALPPPHSDDSPPIPSQIPLPRSPPPELGPHYSDPNSPTPFNTTAERNIMAVADELEDARDDLEDRQHAIFQVRHEMEDLVRQLTLAPGSEDVHYDDP